jgi:hypothetical protein
MFDTNNPFDLSDVFGSSEAIKAQSADRGEFSTQFRPGEYPQHPLAGQLNEHNDDIFKGMRLANERQVENERIHNETAGNRAVGMVPPSMTQEELNALMMYTVGGGLVLVVAYMFLRG